MYDTVHFYIHDGTTDFTQLNKYLKQVKLAYNECGIFKGCIGFIGKFRIQLGYGWMSCKGSLSKAYFGNNVQRMNLQQVKEIIETLSDILHYDVRTLNVTRLDIADNFAMSSPVAKYFQYLGTLARLKRVYIVEKETLKYGTGSSHSLVLYDKTKEIKSKSPHLLKKLEIPTNLLRYEARYSHRLKSRFKRPIINGATLYDEAFFHKIIQSWYDSYSDIEKLSLIQLRGIDKIKNVKDFLNYALNVALINQPPAFVDDIIEKAKEQNIFRYPSEYTRAKNELKKLRNNPLIADSSELITELNRKVRQTYDEMIG
jgi:hypothetical protein